MELNHYPKNGYKLFAIRFLKWLALGDEYSNAVTIPRSQSSPATGISEINFSPPGVSGRSFY